MAKPKSQLEPEFEPLYAAWQNEPGPKSNRAILDALQPAIEKGVQYHVPGAGASLLGPAKIMALDALRTYDPAKAQLKTHVHNTLRGLNRLQRNQSQLIKVPERLAQISGAAFEAERSLQHELGRDPSQREIADHVGVPVREIIRAQGLHHGVTESVFTGEGGSLPGVNQDANEVWAEAVYNSVSPVDQKIMEHTMGLFGKPRYDTARIGRMVKLSPGRVAQRRATIQRMLDQEQDLSPWR